MVKKSTTKKTTKEKLIGQKKVVKKAAKKITVDKRLENIEKKQDQILKQQKQIILKQQKLDDDTDKIIEMEAEDLEGDDDILEQEKEELAALRKVAKNEAEEVEQLKKIQEFEKQIAKEVKESPLKKITFRDVTKGIVGAFLGIVSHFSFAKGVELAHSYTWVRSTILLVVSFLVIILFLYFTGFRRIDEKLLYQFLPVRAVVIYFSAILTTIIVLFLYGKLDFHMPFIEIYNTIAAVSILAVLGAATADLIGKNH